MLLMFLLFLTCIINGNMLSGEHVENTGHTAAATAGGESQAAMPKGHEVCLPPDKQQKQRLPDKQQTILFRLNRLLGPCWPQGLYV